MRTTYDIWHYCQLFISKRFFSDIFSWNIRTNTGLHRDWTTKRATKQISRFGKSKLATVDSLHIFCTIEHKSISMRRVHYADTVFKWNWNRKHSSNKMPFANRTRNRFAFALFNRKRFKCVMRWSLSHWNLFGCVWTCTYMPQSAIHCVAKHAEGECVPFGMA